MRELEPTPAPRPAKEDVVSVPKCTSEGAGYSVECWECRRRGEKFQYIGETSRSPYQRGREHAKDIREGNPAHPMVIHAMEEHGGVPQPVLMRVLSSHLTSMDRQIQESLKGLAKDRAVDACQETATNRQEIPGQPDQETEQEWRESPVGTGGSKRIRQPENMEGEERDVIYLRFLTL